MEAARHEVTLPLSIVTVVIGQLTECLPLVMVLRVYPVMPDGRQVPLGQSS